MPGWQALAVAPGLADGTYTETRVGFRPMGPGIRPLLGPVPGLDGLVVATGLGASGLTMGPLAGSLAAQAALGLPPAIDLGPFAPLPALCLAVQLRAYLSAASGANTTTKPSAHSSDPLTRYPVEWPISSSAGWPCDSERTASTM